MSEKGLMRFGLSVSLIFFALLFLLNIYFVEWQRWACTHVMNCGCGQGYRAIYHGAHKPITCSLDNR
jgi:hypothetical protein